MRIFTKSHTLIVTTALILTAATFSTSAHSAQSKKAAPVTYKQVQAIFDKACIKCHQGKMPPAQMNLQNYEGTMKGNDHGAVVTASHPEKSLLYTLITSTGKKQMPPKKPLAATDIALIGKWIKAGAKAK